MRTLQENHHLNSIKSPIPTMFSNQTDEFSHQQGKQRLSTGSKNLDNLLSGGLETGAITQFYGASNTGKTHLCHLVCVVLPSPYQAIYIDTEGGFREERIQSIATARGLDWTNIFPNIQVLQPKDSKQQESHIKNACSIVKSSESKVKLLIVDSMMFHYIASFSASILSQQST